MVNYTVMGLKQEYIYKYNNMVIERVDSINHATDKVIQGKERYKTIEALTNVPWYFIGILHLRESDCNFNTHLHNGDSLKARTRQVPAGRPVKGNPPFTFEESALDALGYEGFLKIKDWSIEQMAYNFEQYNGWGYRMNGVPSAYLWSGTNQYKSGKYVADHVFDPSVVDVQVGTMAVLKVILERESVSIPGSQVEIKLSPKADPPKPTATELNVVSKKHWWTDWVQWIAGFGAVSGTVIQTAQGLDLQQTKSTIYTIKEIAEMVGTYGVIGIALCIFFYAMYMKYLMKKDAQEGRWTPSQEEIKDTVIPVPPEPTG